jgi:hypothetical protein
MAAVIVASIFVSAASAPFVAAPAMLRQGR